MKSKKIKTRLYCIFGAALILIGAGFLYVCTTMTELSNKPVNVEITNGTSPDNKKDLNIRIKLSKYWPNYYIYGEQYDGTIENNSNQDISKWEINIPVPNNSSIDSSWNGMYKLSQNNVQIKPVDYNAVILKNSKQTFGYVMDTQKLFNINKFNISYYRTYHIEDFVLFWILVGISTLFILVMLVYTIISFRLRRYVKKQEDYKKIIIQTLNTFANIIDAKDSYTKGHSTRVAVYSKEIARRMGMNEDNQDTISYVALLHDVGKIAVSDGVLFKSGALTNEEMQEIRLHTSAGAKILKDFTAIPGIQDGANFHHERYDGKGYPSGIMGENIPLNARIICVADSFDAMSSDRCYRKRLDNDRILSELMNCSGSQFDPDIAVHMIDMLNDGFVRKVMVEYM